MRDKLLMALREAASKTSPHLPCLRDVAAIAKVSEAEVQAQLGSPENFAALLSYQSPAHETRDRILSSAARVFGQTGFQRASLDAVAADAGMTKGAIYWHFKSKNDLFFALLDQRFQQHATPVKVDVNLLMQGAQDPFMGMQTLFLESMRRCTADTEWAHLYLECLSLSRDEEVRKKLANFYDQVWEISAGLNQRLKENNFAPADMDVQVAAIFWSALFDGLVMTWLIKGDSVEWDAVLPKIFEMIWRGTQPKK